MTAARRLWALAGVLVEYFRATSDVRSGLRLCWLRLRVRGPVGDPVRVRVRRLGGTELGLRPGTTDVFAFADDYVGAFCAPPAELRLQDLRQILEIGTNVGYGLAWLAHHAPAATLVGVEPDPGNARLARANVSPWQDRATVVEAAVWDAPAHLDVTGSDEHGREMRAADERRDPGAQVAAGRTADEILEQHLPDGAIDYLLLSAERSELRILGASASWMHRVRAIRVETYEDAERDQAATAAVLARLGFRVRAERDRFGPSVVGLRDT